MPACLMNDADWACFQLEMDLSDLVVLGRASHEATANIRGRRRVVMSRQVQDLEERTDGWWWNPDGMDWTRALSALPGPKQRIAVPGGQSAFDLFLKIGFTSFHLSRATKAHLPGGRRVFSSVASGMPPELQLEASGLVVTDRQVIDPVAGVELAVFRRPGLCGHPSAASRPG